MTEEKQAADTNLAVLNKPLAFVILMLGITFGVLNLQLAGNADNQSLWLTVLYGFLAFICLFIAVFWVYDAYQTQVTEHYIQKGKVRVDWKEVTDSISSDISVVIISGPTRLAVNYYAYRNPEGLRSAIKSKLESQE